MQVSSEGLEILKDREALKLKAYQDQGGVWTIGYGATTYESGAKVKAGDVISEIRAVQLLAFHVGKAAAAVESLVSVDVNQGQFDALTSFVYNVGATAFAKSGLRTLINTNPNDLDRIEAAFMQWIYVTVNGVKVQSNGLIDRRKEEVEMYRSGTAKKKVRYSGSRRSASS